MQLKQEGTTTAMHCCPTKLGSCYNWQQVVTCDLHHKRFESIYTGELHQVAQPLCCQLSELCGASLHRQDASQSAYTGSLR